MMVEMLKTLIFFFLCVSEYFGGCNDKFLSKIVLRKLVKIVTLKFEVALTILSMQTSLPDVEAIDTDINLFLSSFKFKY